MHALHIRLEFAPRYIKHPCFWPQFHEPVTHSHWTMIGEQIQLENSHWAEKVTSAPSNPLAVLLAVTLYVHCWIKFLSKPLLLIFRFHARCRLASFLLSYPIVWLCGCIFIYRREISWTRTVFLRTWVLLILVCIGCNLL